MFDSSNGGVAWVRKQSLCRQQHGLQHSKIARRHRRSLCPLPGLCVREWKDPPFGRCLEHEQGGDFGARALRAAAVESASRRWAQEPRLCSFDCRRPSTLNSIVPNRIFHE